VTRIVEAHISDLDNAITVVFWEECGLAASHPLQVLFAELEKQGGAKIKLFAVPSERQVAARVEKIVAAGGGSISSEAVTWIGRAYSLLGKQARLALRLKNTEELLEDERGWWLHTLLENALLAAADKEITISLLESIYEPEAAVGVFEVVTALTNRRFDQARQLLKAAEGDDSFYFSLLAALRWQARKVHNEGLQRLTVEMELILKNFTVQPAWVADLLVARLEEGGERMIISARRLWLFHLLRS